MLYPEGLMHRKVNAGLALLVIFIIAGIFAWIISARALSFGGSITESTECVLDPDSGTCPNCPLCTGLQGSACGGSIEILFTPAGGAYKFICPVKAYPFKRGSIPSVGSFILGEGTQIAPSQSW